MNLQKLTMNLQEFCHLGHSLDEVEILDSNGNVVCLLDDVTLIKDNNRNVIQIKAHHKNK